MKEPSIIETLRQRFARAIAGLTDTTPDKVDPLIRPASDPRFGDYQCNAAMPLAKQLKARPRDIAARIAEAVELDDLAEPLEIAGPGFLNIRLSAGYLARRLGEIGPADEGADRCGIAPVEDPQTVVIDYSSPNIAKRMHVGHLRSTIIGDAFARLLAFLGHRVIRQNHVGDWGTQFGMLIAWYRRHPVPSAETHDDVLAAIEEHYRQAQELFKSDPQFAEQARAAVGALQSGDPAARQVWQTICAASRRAFLEIYALLNVLLTDEDVCGESFYNDRLAPLVAELREKLSGEGGPVVMREDQGAQCLFFYDDQGRPLFRKPDGSELPMIVQKSDGAFLYATTDLAAIRYRILELGADRVIYVTDARQKLHFQMLFAVARAVGWATPQVNLEHVTFGSVLGEDKRPLKTREGQNVKLRELLDEAQRRALALLESRQQDADQACGPPLSEEEKRLIARRVGIAAVKYADLRNDRVSDYVFSWQRMLALQGNTAPYMMYAYARIRSIYRKAAGNVGAAEVYGDAASLRLEHPAERTLALRLARLPETIDAVALELAPHILCGYLYELAAEFMRFYEACPVLKAPDHATRLSRLRLCDLTARTLKLGLGLLGIETIERM